MREQRQKEAVKAFLSSDKRSIINACCRFGKTKVAIDILKECGYKKPVIVAPRNDIKEGWSNDTQKFDYDYPFEFFTTKSIHKIPQDTFDVMIMDEPHEFSENQQKALFPLSKSIPTIALTGTITQKTRTELYNNLLLDVCYKYSLQQGVEEEIICDYNIDIHKVKLDDSVFKYFSRSGRYTEKKYFGLQSYLQSSESNPLSRHFFELKMINILQNSLSKMNKTVQLIQESGDERVLVFCGVTEIADKLGIPAYHSKKKEKQLFDDFCNGKGNKMVAIQMLQAGITIVPISRVLMNYTSGSPETAAQKISRVLGKEMYNVGKKAQVDIITTDETFEISRVRTALSFFDKEKINNL